MFRKSGLLTLVCIIILALTGCAPAAESILKLKPEPQDRRATQTQTYEGVSEANILSAANNVIREMGFKIDKSEKNLGVIVGTKRPPGGRTSRDELVIDAAISALVGSDVSSSPIDERIRVAFSVKPGDADRTYVARVTFRRIVWDPRGQITDLEELEQPEMYREFFDRLSYAISQ